MAARLLATPAIGPARVYPAEPGPTHHDGSRGHQSISGEAALMDDMVHKSGPHTPEKRQEGRPQASRKHPPNTHTINYTFTHYILISQSMSITVGVNHS